MPKPLLAPPFDTLETEIITTMLAGLHEWRPDLDYPKSHSDMEGCVRALLRRFDMKRLPIDRRLPMLDAEEKPKPTIADIHALGVKIDPPDRYKDAEEQG